MKLYNIYGLAFLAVLAMTSLLPRKSVAQSLYAYPEGVETRWASPENPNGEKSHGAPTNAGRKGRPAIPFKAGERVTLAEVHGSSGTIKENLGHDQRS